MSAPAVVRSKGDALFWDWRYDHAFACHKGAQSHGALRGLLWQVTV